MNIDAETPVSAILNAEGVNKRALMTRLACVVFGKAEGHILRAYTQFSPQSLASLVEARRKGVFDYGETIRKLSVGAWTFPKDPVAVLKALDLADGEKYDEVDLEALDLLDDEGKPLIDLGLLFPAMKKPRKTAQPKEEPEPQLKVQSEPLPPEAGPSEEELEELRAERAAHRAKNMAGEAKPTPSKEPVEQENGGGKPVIYDGLLSGLENRISTLASDLADALGVVVEENRLHAVQAQGELSENTALTLLALERQDALASNIDTLAKALLTFDANVRQLSLYFVDPHMEFEPLELPFVDLPTTLTYSEDSGEEEESSAQGEDESVEEEEPRPTPLRVVAEEKAEEEEEEVEKGEPTTDRYTQEQLEAMDLAELRSYAEGLGCTPARWQKTNVNRILAEYQRQDSE